MKIKGKIVEKDKGKTVKERGEQGKGDIRRQVKEEGY